MEYVKREDSAAALYPATSEGLIHEEVYHQQLNLAEVIQLAVQGNPAQLHHHNQTGLALPQGLRSNPTMMQTVQLMGGHRMNSGQSPGAGQMGPNHALAQRGPQGTVPLPFQIKAELEEGAYYYEPMMHTFSNNLTATIAVEHPAASVAPTAHTDEPPPVQYVFNGHTGSIEISTVPPPDSYVRQTQFFQNYTADNEGSAQNLKVHRQYENALRDTLPNENTKPIVNKMYYANYDNASDFNGAADYGADKNAEDEIYGCLIDGGSPAGKKYFCKMCSATFTAKKRLQEHVKLCTETGAEAADKSPKVQCKHCPYKCMSAAILKIHERTHTGEKPFSCNFCDYKSGQKNNVAKHILVHMKEKPFRCQYCDYRCAQKNNLVVHERTHTGFKPFACTLCDYKTVQKPNLVKHMYLHTGQKPFSCDLCSYKCVQKTNLTKHKQRHDKGERTDYVNRNANRPYRPRQNSFKCPLCPFKCVRKLGLDKHTLYKHGSEVRSETGPSDPVVYVVSDQVYVRESRTLLKSPEVPVEFESGSKVPAAVVEAVAYHVTDGYEKQAAESKMEGNDGRAVESGMYVQDFKREQVYAVDVPAEGFPAMRPS